MVFDMGEQQPYLLLQSIQISWDCSKLPKPQLPQGPNRKRSAKVQLRKNHNLSR